MRLVCERRAAAAIVVSMLIVAAGGASAAQGQPVPSMGAPNRGEIERAIETVMADPNLGIERTIKVLRWRQSSSPHAFQAPSWLKWIFGFFGWVGESARVLVWCVALGLAGLLAVYLVRIARTRLASQPADTFVIPTHVRELDIRPETLPDDIGAAARQLWERGERRAALALLYRGMLSRLVHVHSVPIRDSSTEGDCLALATARLPKERLEYLSRLVHVWQRFVYGRQQIDAVTMHSLCDQFASALRPVSTINASLQRGSV